MILSANNDCIDVIYTYSETSLDCTIVDIIIMQHVGGHDRFKQELREEATNVRVGEVALAASFIS